VKVGDTVTAGQPIARVGLSGDTEFPHLHVTVRHEGQTVDPFAPDMSQPNSCRPQTSLWTAAALRQMAYRSGVVLNAGFAPGPVKMDDVEGGGIHPPTAQSPYLVAYARAIELEAGDEVELTLLGADGHALATNRSPPLDNDKAQWLNILGRKRPAAGWPHGVYRAEYRVWRKGAAVIERRFQLSL